jgi:hypothetical protein
VYDVAVDVLDFSEANITLDPETGDMSGKTYHFDIGNVSKSAWGQKPIGELPMPDSGDLHYTIMIQARNGDITEEITGTRDDKGQWHIKLVVKRYNSIKHKAVTLYEEKDSQKYFLNPQTPLVPIDAPTKPVSRRRQKQKPVQ